MPTKYLISILILFILLSCENKKEQVRSKQGSVNAIINIYIGASKGLDSVMHYQISNMNYFENEIVELIPNISFPNIIEKVYFINDTLCYDMGSIDEAERLIPDEKKWFSIFEKQEGLIFIDMEIPQYSSRINISDTILFKKKYKRFDIDDDKFFRRYYVYTTDTIIPYSLNRKIDDDYNGRLERIDTYNKTDDVFITMQLFHSKNIDERAKDIFDYHKYINDKSKEIKK